MLELINTTQQTVAANGTVGLGSASVLDRANRMVLTDGAIQINAVGKYSINGLFGLYNSTSAAVDATIQMYANGTAISGSSYTVTVPATGYTELVIKKTINVAPAPYGNAAKITFVSSTGATVNNTVVDVYKRS
jgi:hypothetical protein